MKRFIVWFVIALFATLIVAAFVRLAMAEDGPPAMPPTKGQCPVTRVVGDVGDCFKCHVAGSFEVRLAPFDALIDYPNSATKFIKTADSRLIGQFFLRGTIVTGDADNMRDALYFFSEYPVTRVEIIIESGGGHMFAGWSVVGVIQKFQKEHPEILIKTSLYSFAGSAAFLIYLAGDVREVNPYAFFMWHEVLKVTFLSIDTASTIADDKETLDLFQGVANTYIQERTEITQEVIEEAIYKKMWWFTGMKAIELGVATELMF